MITPWLHLYNKPKAQASDGLQFIKRYQAFNYKHQIDAMGWFDTMKCELNLSRHESESFMQNYLGNEVRIFVDNPNYIVWEGYINRITLKRGGLVTTRSLDPMANRVQVIYDDPSTTPQQTRSTAVTNANSIAVYGSKSGTFEVGTNRGAETMTTGIGDLKLAQLAWPKTSSAVDTSGGLSLEIECLGFYHTIKWEKYAVTDTTVEAIGAIMFRFLFGTASPTLSGWNTSRLSPEGVGIFYDDTDTSLWNANTSYTTPRELRSQTVWDKLVKICESGDGSNDWLVGLSPTDPSRGYRRAYYRMANTDVKYVAYLRDGLKVRNVYGGIVNPWQVQPDGKIRIADMAVNARVGQAGQDDPRELWIKKISYDANSNSVTWQGKDDITIEGLFGFKEQAKNMGEKFGANERLSYV